jgi:SAM-dependent methyltransferase
MRENVFGHVKKVRLLQAALARLRQSRLSLSVLDVGCGNGSAVTRHIASLSDDVSGIDFHDPSVQYARDHFGRPGLRFSNTPIERVAGRYDAIIFTDFLEHVDAPEMFLATARRLLKPDGRVLVTIPNGYGPFEWESGLKRLPYLGHVSFWLIRAVVAVLNRFIVRGAWSGVAADPNMPYNHESGHVQFFARKRFLALVASNGFTVASARNLSFLSGPYTDHLLAPSAWFCRLNNWVADTLPARAASAWFFELSATAEAAVEAAPVAGRDATGARGAAR